MFTTSDWYQVQAHSLLSAQWKNDYICYYYLLQSMLNICDKDDPLSHFSQLFIIYHGMADDCGKRPHPRTQDFLTRIIPDMRTVVPEILGGASLPVAEGDGDVPVSLQELPLVLLAHHRPHTLTVSPPTSLLPLLFCDLCNKTSLSFSLLL